MRQFKAFHEYPFLRELHAREEMTHLAQTVWQAVAPENLAELSQAQEIVNQQLKLSTPHNAVAAKIKLLTPSILKTLKNQGYEVTAIHVKVQVKSTPPKKAKKIKKISHQAAHSLSTLAEKMPNSPLGEALARLAKKSSN
jgi:hypothetical protein